MRQQWDNEELKEATTMCSNDWDHDLVQEVEGNRGNKGEDTLKMIFIHMREELQELQDGPSSPSTHSVMLSMGGGFRGQARSHGVR